MPDFETFYQAVTGHPPFPWQARLAREVADHGHWPDEVGIPTGLGKTACLYIAVWWLAVQADCPLAVRTAPTRIWWVVNRRLLVDATANHAFRLKNMLEGQARVSGRDAADAVAGVAARLRSLSAGADAPPLQVIRLRGGVAPDRPADPSRPAIILCTLPMYGSRLLFRGYGSKGLRSADAALAGTDSLILLDEAHLARHLKKLLQDLPECAAPARPVVPHRRARPLLVALTATGDRPGNRFDLDEKDYAHPEIRRRLEAAKPLHPVEKTSGDAGRLLAEEAVGLLKDAAGKTTSVLVFANTPKTARAAYDALLKKKTGAEILLLSGQVREREAGRLRQRILDPANGMAASRPERAGRTCPLVVVATQTLEVGADIDADYLVTEQCGVRALTQRLGRLNRLGRTPNARAIYLHLPPPGRNGDWPVYGTEPGTVLDHLKRARDAQGVVPLPPGKVAGILGPPKDDPGRAPEIMPELLWEWMKTTTPPAGAAPVDPYFSGIKGPEYTVAVIWRAHLPDPAADDTARPNKLWPRPTDREAIQIPLGAAREVFEGDKVCRTRDDRTLELVKAKNLRPGDCIVLRSDRGLMDAFGWNPAATAPVVDVSLARRGVPLDAGAIERLCGIRVADDLVSTARGDMAEWEDPDRDAQAEAAAQIRAMIQDAPTPGGQDPDEWADFVNSLEPAPVTPHREVARLPVRWPEREQPDDDEDERSMGTNTGLDRHCRDVAACARAIAHHIGLSDDLCAIIERAGALHDIGKADDRFQNWLDPKGLREAPVAKSHTPRHTWQATRRDSGWPHGGRHELLSARLAHTWLEGDAEFPADDHLRDLLVHLVISHHGKGRPLVPPVADATGTHVRADVDGATVEAPATLAQVDWEQPGRFRRLNARFGPWGLALLEAVVIGADHAVSAGKATADAEEQP
ncbi:MAG: type I-U CRISPR-associated helicase/endonuclease Cas3 [Rhodobacteraceae bacterium]|nr:type I-U CRISPR-associated helicase/endonuclease Cas3 [Paracoccaceae bacterium]